MKKLTLSFVAGLVFSLGLGISGMTDPAKVIAFLDVTGNWDPSLAFVMGGAMVPNIILFRFILKRDKPLFDIRFHLPTSTVVDGSLLGGAALFGVGWGLSGYCPGPAITSVAGGGSSAILFVAAMVVGVFLHRVVWQSLIDPLNAGRAGAPTAKEVVSSSEAV